ncbi:MAG: 7-cyano-7-deazaguanine synthase QueC [Candidatus Margulisbacteria bacterium]|nr:7-cyano-7-deazaguanine synthase QueC [Candidatus Margulisiibacteriota bacterium]
MNKHAALIILSGGQDSTTALYWSKKKFKLVKAVTFDYGQRHKREIGCARKIAKLAQVQHKVIKINFYKDLSSNALVTENAIKINKKNNLPSTFVPGRNLIFINIAAAYAYEQGIPNLVLGVSQVDYSGYPDCREETIKSQQKTISLGMEFPFVIHTPLIHKTKKETVELARELGMLKMLKFTHTCYLGGKAPCGKCPACLLRAKGFKDAGIKDPLL